MIPSHRAPENRTSELLSLEQRCFDPARATSLTRIVPLAQVVDLLQVTHAPDRVAEYRNAMKEGKQFPPIAVIPLAGRFIITDGHKRFAAYKTLQVGQIVVEIWTTRRCLRDLARQGLRQAHRGWCILSRTHLDAGARAETLKYLRSQVTHWKRIVASMLGRIISC